MKPSITKWQSRETVNYEYFDKEECRKKAVVYFEIFSVFPAGKKETVKRLSFIN